MSQETQNKETSRLSQKEARLLIKAIEELEKEEAAKEEEQRQSSKPASST